MSDHEDETITEENAPPKVVPWIITKFKEFKISKEEGLDKGYDKMQKILTQMNTLKIKLEPEDVNMKFLRGLPPYWSCIALILKTKGGLEYISFDDLYNKLKFLEIDTKGYSSSFSTLSNAAFVSTVGSSQGNLSYQESGNGCYTTTLSASPGYLSSKGSSKSKCSVFNDVIYSFFANHEIDQHLVHRFEKKHGRNINFNGSENARIVDISKYLRSRMNIMDPLGDDETITEENAPPKVVPQITTVTNISATLSKEERGNSAKSMITDNDGNLKIRPPVTAEEHQQVQREEKARTILLSALPDEHMDDFYHMIDVRDIWNAIKARFEEGLDKGYDKVQKIMTQMNTLKIKPEPKDVNMKFLRGLPPSWSGIALIIKTKGGLEYILFDDLYNKLKFLEIDAKGYLSSSSTLSNASFVCTAGSSQGNLSYQESKNSGYTNTLSVSLGSSSSKGSLKYKFSVVDDVIYSFFANHKINQHLVYEDLDQLNKEEFQEYDLKNQMAMITIKKYKSKEAGKDGPDSKTMVVVDGSIDWDKQTEEGNTESRSLENFGMVAGIEIASDADSEGEVVSANNAIHAGVSVSAGDVAAAVAKWNNSGKNLYKLINSSMSVRTKRGLGIDKYIGEVDHMKAVPPPLTRNYMPPSNIPDIDESQMVYGKKATDSSEIKTNDSVLFDFSDRSSEPSTNDLQTYDSNMECSRPNHSDHDSTDSIFSVSAPASESRYTIVIDCDRQEDFPSVCSIETDVKYSKTLCNKFGSFNKKSHSRKHKSVAFESCYVYGSYLHLINDCDLHEQRFAKRNAKGKVSAGQLNPVSAGDATLACNSIPLFVSAGDGILGPRPLNIKPKSTYFHSFTHNNQQIIFPITHNLLYSLYMTGGLNGKTAVKPSVDWPWTKYGISKTKGSKINSGSKSKSWSYAKGPLGRPKLEKAKDRGIIDSGCSQSMSRNKDKLEDFEDFDGGEVTFGGSTGKISGKGTIKTKNLNFKNVIYVEEL
nr:hypothetical protein [Tanacetum cinerariifolium]